MENLAKQLEDDLESFIAQKILESKNSPRSFNFDNKSVEEIAEEMKQHPAFMTEFDESKPMSPAVEALQVLKYESQSCDDNATSYKDDGNKNFERQKYRWAADNYTAGLNCHPTDSKLTTVLYTNRAAANFHIGNYRSSLNDCMSALNITNDHKKAWIRAVDCLMKLEKFKEVVDWSDKALMLFPTEAKLQACKLKSEQKMKELERNKRRQNKINAQLKGKQLKIIRTLQQRGIILYKESRKDKSILVETKNDDDWLDVIKQSHNGSCIEMVKKDENSTSPGIPHEVELLYPVIFLYPEYNQSDFIMSFHEHSKFEEHLKAMFGPCCDPPSWDEKKLYLPSKLQVYFEERDLNDESSVKLHVVPHNWSLLNVLQSGKFKFVKSVISFILLVKDSEFEKLFIKNYA